MDNSIFWEILEYLETEMEKQNILPEYELGEDA